LRKKTKNKRREDKISLVLLVLLG